MVNSNSSSNSKYVVLDTNVLLLDANHLTSLGADGTTVIIPATVLEELDSKKSGYGELAYQSRATSRLLATKTDVKIVKADDHIQIKMNIGNVRVILMSKDKYDVDSNHPSKNDQEIIEVALLAYRLFGSRNVKFITNDGWCGFQALAAGLSVSEIKISDKEDYCFVKEIKIKDDDVFRNLHNTDIYAVDPDYKLENYSYKFINEVTGQIKLATIVNGFISIIGKDTEKQLRVQDAIPINSEQMLVSKAIQDPSIDLVIIEGKAGSGKNIMALSNAIKLMKMNRDKYDNIVYMRSPIDDEDLGEDIGYRTGEEAKLGVYLGPVEDTIEFLARNRLTASNKGKKKAEIDAKVQQKIIDMKTDYNITSRITTGTRGLTFPNTILWLDEASNYSPATMQKILSRSGKHCKLIVTGSQNQIDSKYLTRHNNGLAVLMHEASERRIDTNINIFAITLQKVVRSDMALFAEDLFSRRAQ